MGWRVAHHPAPDEPSGDDVAVDCGTQGTGPHHALTDRLPDVPGRNGVTMVHRSLDRVFARLPEVFPCWI